MKYFESILPLLEKEGQVAAYGPTDFADFLSQHQFASEHPTAQVLSIDTLGKLPAYLRENHTMVFRMGGSDPLTRTRFVLVRAPDAPECFFLKDAEIFHEDVAQLDLDPLGSDRFLAYRLVPKLQEMALVNLAMGSGALGRCLDLEEPIVHAPAMLSSRYTFKLRLHPQLDTSFDHNSGQVEIDGMFTAYRDGQLHLFVIEAKFVRSDSSVAKHKIVYPVAAMLQDAGIQIPVVPVYLSVLETPDQYIYRIAECQLPVTEDLPVLAELQPRKVMKVAVKRYDTDTND